MKSLKALYRIGAGPSSSHTMGPERIARRFLTLFTDAAHYRVTLYGSLAATGRGHGTDTVIRRVMPADTEVIFASENTEIEHPNTMDLTAEYRDHTETRRAYSLGGGAIAFRGEANEEEPEIYTLSTFREIADLCRERGWRLSDYVFVTEGEEIREYLLTVWKTMCACIDEGLSTTGILPGGLGVARKAHDLYEHRDASEPADVAEDRLVCAYAYATAEQNASGGTVVTAPTCGAAGVMPAALKYMQVTHDFSDDRIVRALAAGGLVGNLIKTNASISGAECGCQAEIGSATSMTAAALAELFDRPIAELEYAAELSMEHHLGLTCDPVRGLVQIPCIERNAVAALRAINAISLAGFLTNTRKVSFDTIVRTMYETGRDLGRGYRETSEKGLASLYRDQDEGRA